MSTNFLRGGIPADFMFAHACAISSGVLSEEQHRKCSQHPYKMVRKRWAQRQDLTTNLVLAALGIEQDAEIRATLLSNPVISGTDVMWWIHGGDRSR